MLYVALPLILLGVIVLLVLWLVSLYNNFVVLSKRRDEAWSGVKVQLKRRHDLVPNLVATVKGYASHESQLLEAVTKARSMNAQAGPGEASAAEAAFSSSLVRLLAVAESYPELKANKNFQEMQATLVEIEDEIQMARRYFNGTVRDYNTRIATFPGLLLAQRYNFRESESFDLEAPSEEKVPVVSFS